MGNVIDDKWQPVVLILNKRLECRCGSLAVFVTGTFSDEEKTKLVSFEAWCQSCFLESPSD